MKFLPIGSIGAVLGSGISTWYGLNFWNQKTLRQYLEWRGYEVVSHSDKATWKAIKEERPSLVYELFSGDNIEDQIRDWCESHLELSSYLSHVDTASRICVNDVRTIRGKIVQRGTDLRSLLNRIDDYKVAYVFRKDTLGFLDLIGYPPNENLDEAAQFYRRWCEKSLDSEWEELLLANVESLCKPKGFSTIKEFINDSGKKLITEEDGALEAKFKLLEADESFKTEFSDKEKLKSWCEETASRGFFEGFHVLKRDYPKVKSRCVKD